jgi:uncharacterized protein (UPF0335 family)
MDKLPYIVLAQTAVPRQISKVVLSQDIKTQINSRVIIVGFVVCVVLIAILAVGLFQFEVRIEERLVIVILILSLIPALFIAFKTHRRLVTKAKEQLERARMTQELERLNREAAALTNDVKQIYRTAVEAGGQIREHLTNASGWLRKAENEYRASAFDPYWTAIEHAATHLGEGSRKTREVASKAQSYYKKLNGQRHTFPAFPVHHESLPATEAITVEFRRIVRLGQTNFEFANIWEHRRTREVLIGGFRTLGDAVNNLGLSITESIKTLEQSTSSDIARLVEEEISTREKLDGRAVEQNRMLDNLQSKRKPTALDRPTKY